MFLLGIGIVVTVYRVGYGSLYEQRLATVKAVVDVADDIVRYYGEMERSGGLSGEEARRMASEEISKMRYNGEDYLFGYDMDQRVTIPFQGHGRGKRLDSQDENGVWVHREFVNIIRSSGEGVLVYNWLNSNSGEVEEKVAYVKGYSPWGWWYGTGLYVSDLRKEVDSLALKVLAAIVCGLIATVAVVLWLVRKVTRRIGSMVGTIERMADGDLTVRFEDSDGDEISSISSSLDETVKKLGGALSEVEEEASITGRRSEELASVSDDQRIAMDETLVSVGEMADLIENNSAALEEINASIEEVSSSARSTADKISEGAGRTAAMVKVSGEVESGLDGMFEEIKGADERSRSGAEGIRSLADSVRSISQFVETITTIADQTNLLALNAAIEAARAGEAGRGFAVVAEEVRKLAEESAHAAGKVGSMIEKLQADSSVAIRSTEETVEAMDRVAKGVDEAKAGLDRTLELTGLVDDVMRTLASQAEEQSASTEEMAKAVEAVTQATMRSVELMSVVKSSADRISEGTERVSVRSGEMADGARRLTERLDRFVLEDRSGLIPLDE
ncbi:methyl-accepting chemotaxis protein [Dethiosulfovibrio sp. F2B]|uniref:methyl-accepting chemotaxis protein n=1 Tax=Dethiosulfovibrio faecalis TaxID=2720018 RepID=UPI001F1DEDA4|nr:methyl-accepting chemotaxis protein [Dethiosulfovibrio faecalis]MCF4151597.1 methyl-accepting chemotaxis protein [Dethiosulfovibrio faecalis]